MENSIIKDRFEKGLRLILIALTLVITIGLFIDIIFNQNLNKLLTTFNYFEIGINILVLIGFTLNKIEIRKSFGIVAYSLLVNSLLSSALTMALPVVGLEIFMKDSIFIIIIIVFSGFVLGKIHSTVQGVIYLTFLICYTFLSQQPFLLKNFILIAFVVIIVCVMLFFLKTVFDSTIEELDRLLYLLKKRNEGFENQNIILKNQAHELSCLNEALEIKKEKLHAQKEDLQKVNLTKDKLFSIVSHDLRDLVSSIYGSSQYLEEKFLEMDDSKKYKFVSIINESTQKLSELLENLLQWSRSQSNKINFSKDNLNLYRVVSKVIEPNKLRLADKQIFLINSIPKNIVTEGDAQLLFIIFHNLISNAIKFTPPGGAILVTLTDTLDYQLVEIVDDGVGMEIDRYETLFKLNPGENQIGTDGEKGTGLGLTLCKEFVEMHGGKIGAKPNSGKGSIFWFSLPKSTSGMLE